MIRLLIALILFATGNPMSEAKHQHGQQRQHGNPDDLDSYIKKMEDPTRDEWQQPIKVLNSLKIAPQQVICDIGAGPGYFSLKMAKKIPDGRIFAVDVVPKMLDVLRERIKKQRINNITPILALPDNSLLPNRSCDLILIVNTYHHFPDGIAYLTHLKPALKKGGKIVNIDFFKRELPLGPPIKHKIAKRDFILNAKKAGLEVSADYTFLKYQYFLVLTQKN